MLCVAANGFDPDSGRPRPGFHSFVIKIRIKDEQDQFFLSRGVKEDNVVDVTHYDGTLVTDPDFPNRTVTAFLMYTQVPLVEAQMRRQAVEFLAFVNQLVWKGKPLASSAALLTPSPWLKKEKIGDWIGTTGIKKLVSKVDKHFTPYEFWGHNNALPARNFWEPGTWTYADAAYFGVDPSWMNSEGKGLHAAALSTETEAVKPEETEENKF